MWPQAFGLVLAGLWLLGGAGCASKREAAGDSQERRAIESASVAPVAEDAPRRPGKDEATVVIERFASALLAKDLGKAQGEMRIPANLGDKQVAFFLRELANGEHLSEEGLARVLAKDLGTLEERMGEKAAAVAEGAQLPAGEAYVLGDPESAVVLHWDGARFWIAALHGLGPEG